MPSALPRSIDDCDSIIREAFLWVFAHPGELYVVAPDASIAYATRLSSKLKAVRQGFTRFHPPEHEWHRAALNNRLHIKRDYKPKAPELRTVTLKYEGLLLRPSEEAAKALADFHAGLRSSPF